MDALMNLDSMGALMNLDDMEDTSKRQIAIYNKKFDTKLTMSDYKLYNICSWSDNKPFPLHCFNPRVPGFFDLKNDRVEQINFNETFNQQGLSVTLDNFIMKHETIIDLVNRNSYKRIFIGVLNSTLKKQNWYVLEKTETETKTKTDAASAFSKNKSMKKKSMKNKSIKNKSIKKKSNKKKSMKNKSIKKKSNKKKSMKKL